MQRAVRHTFTHDEAPKKTFPFKQVRLTVRLSHFRYMYIVLLFSVFRCEVCSTPFQNTAHLQVHMLVCGHGSRNSACDYAGGEVQKHYCIVCRKGFPNEVTIGEFRIIRRAPTNPFCLIDCSRFSTCTVATASSMCATRAGTSSRATRTSSGIWRCTGIRAATCTCAMCAAARLASRRR